MWNRRPQLSQVTNIHAVPQATHVYPASSLSACRVWHRGHVTSDMAATIPAVSSFLLGGNHEAS